MCIADDISNNCYIPKFLLSSGGNSVIHDSRSNFLLLLDCKQKILLEKRIDRTFYSDTFTLFYGVLTWNLQKNLATLDSTISTHDYDFLKWSDEKS